MGGDDAVVEADASVGVAGEKEPLTGSELVPAASSVLQNTLTQEDSPAAKEPDAGEKGPTGMSDKKQKTKSLWTLFILSFLAGFAALLTPCVFPMIPMTVSFFTKQSKNKAVGIRNAILFGVSIVVLYVLLGTVVTSIFGADSLNALSTNVWFNLIFFALLVVFAISFLGSPFRGPKDTKTNTGLLITPTLNTCHASAWGFVAQSDIL